MPPPTVSENASTTTELSPESDWVNIASHLPAMAADQPDTLAVAFPSGRSDGNADYLQWSYAQLDRQSDILARGLRAVGIERNMRTVLMVKPSPEFFALVFALFKLGAVMVGVDPGMGIRNLKTCLGRKILTGRDSVSCTFNGWPTGLMFHVSICSLNPK